VRQVPDDHWLDREAGPVVRPYALTGGRTRPRGETVDLLAIVTSTVGGQPLDRILLEPEHLRVPQLCRRPLPVADLASDLDLPLGVVRILLSDMRERGLRGGEQLCSMRTNGSTARLARSSARTR